LQAAILPASLRIMPTSPRRLTVISFIANLWKRLSLLGTHYAHQDEFIRRRVVLSNQIGVAGGFLGVSVIIISAFQSSVGTAPPTGFAIFYLLLVPFLNWMGYTSFSRLSLSIVLPVSFLVGALHTKYAQPEAYSIVYYFLPRFTIMASLLCSATLLDVRKPWQMGLGMGVNALCLLLLDPVHRWAGFPVEQADLVLRNYGMVTVVSTAVFFFLAAGYIFLQYLNQHHERRITRLYEEMKETNEELRLSEEEIKQNAEELASINESLHQQNEVVRAQHKTIEQRNLALLDSMTYARRVQKGFVSRPDLLQGLFPESFTLDMPRDLVSGDFYWATRLGEWRVVALCDCTGHGTAAALMTMVAHTLLATAMLEEGGDFWPHRVLYRIDEGLQDALAGQEIYDGLDIALLGVHPEAGLRYAGAHQPLHYVPPGQPLRTVKPSPASIGLARTLHEKHFETHALDLPEGSWLYLSSDGFQDQFDASDSRKLYGKNFRAMLEGGASFPPHEQQHRLYEQLRRWKGDNRQTDDILVLGFRV
jgi:serine phosphatase RsbU (regulator of sigma subunit)